jgi:hypothetical protein
MSAASMIKNKILQSLEREQNSKLLKTVGPIPIAL